MFKKKAELPLRPKMPLTNQLIQDIENAPSDDPVFIGSVHPVEDNRSFSLAQEFMATTQRLKDLEILLVKQQKDLQKNHKELLLMLEKLLHECGC